MVVVTSTRTLYPCTSLCKPISPSLLYLRQICGNPRRANGTRAIGPRGVWPIKSYMENRDSISGFANKVIGSLPVVGLVARIFSDEGGVGGDIIDFAEFRRRVGKKSSIVDSRAFYEFQDRRGRRRAKLNTSTPSIPMEIRMEKALEAIYVCCFGKDLIEKEDERLLQTMLGVVFPSVKQSQIQMMISDLAKKVAEGGNEVTFLEAKPLPKEAAELQMKDLQFLRQNSET
ncbi:photosystem I assembly factor PSA3, chloroplastic isoform X2 [Rhodamnia argentea]|uniref:Photosystem I assembly factor PSA3, chloroplastic isoform X2 n=1 Tax=Rhodamnia argentea TaxID=178133 RepID=A0ABM3GWL5_9MYRT|nr:photosystem I assembly factor PSA3, chloroplastic isoform X2 [Rhodamnia argentea]